MIFWINQYIIYYLKCHKIVKHVHSSSLKSKSKTQRYSLFFINKTQRKAGNLHVLRG